MLNKELMLYPLNNSYVKTSLTVGREGNAFGYLNDEDYSFGKLNPSLGLTGLAVNSSGVSYCVTFAGGYTPSAIVVAEVLSNEWDPKIEELYFPEVQISITKENVFDLLPLFKSNVNQTLSLYIKISAVQELNLSN